MSDGYEFQSPFARGGGANPWFPAGSVPVTTTVFVTALGFLGVVVRVIEGPGGVITSGMVLLRSAITGGQIWRIATWPFPVLDANGFIWALLSLVFFYMIGSQLESMVGRQAFTGLTIAMILVPGIAGAVVAVITNSGLAAAGISVLFFGIALGFAAAFPKAKSFFGIPFWALVGVFYVIQLFSLLADRRWPSLAMMLVGGSIGLIGVRSLGFAPSVEWIPTVRLPNAMNGSTEVAAPKARKRGKRKNKAGLAAVPEPSASEAEIDALLDQVSEQGFDSLTRKEKQILQRHSKEMRKRRDG